MVVRDIEQSAREILTLLQTVHQTDGIKSGIYMGLAARKPVFGVCDKASFKPVSSATETT